MENKRTTSQGMLKKLTSKSRTGLDSRKHLLKDRDEEYDVEMQQERAHERRRQRWENSMGPPDDRPPQK